MFLLTEQSIQNIEDGEGNENNGVTTAMACNAKAR